LSDLLMQFEKMNFI